MDFKGKKSFEVLSRIEKVKNFRLSVPFFLSRSHEWRHVLHASLYYRP